MRRVNTVQRLASVFSLISPPLVQIWPFSLDIITCPFNLGVLHARWKVHSITDPSQRVLNEVEKLAIHSVKWDDAWSQLRSLFTCSCKYFFLSLQNVSLATSKLQHPVTNVNHVLKTPRNRDLVLCFVPVWMVSTGPQLTLLLDPAQVNSPLHLYESFELSTFRIFTVNEPLIVISTCSYSNTFWKLTLIWMLQDWFFVFSYFVFTSKM